MEAKIQGRNPLSAIVQGGIFRPRDLESLGVHRSQLHQMERRGEVEHIARGLYRITSGEVTEHFTVLAVCTKRQRLSRSLASGWALAEIRHQLRHQSSLSPDQPDRPALARVRVVSGTEAAKSSAPAF